MSRRISSTEARDQPTKLVDAAEHGQAIELTREGRLVAEIASHHRQSLEELRRGELEFSSDPGRLRQMLED